MSTSRVLEVGDGVSIPYEHARAAADHVLTATSLILEEEPLSEAGLDVAITNLAHMLGGPEWIGHATHLIESATYA